MLYAVLCYHDEAAVDAMTGQQEDALMRSLTAVHEKLSAQGKLAQAARLMPTTAAVTFRQRSGPWVVDGPFAETKEALLGFYILDCATLDEAIEAARLLDTPRSAAGLASALEIRPIRLSITGSGAK